MSPRPSVNPDVVLTVPVQMPAPMWHFLASVAERHSTTIAAVTYEILRRSLEHPSKGDRISMRVWTADMTAVLTVMNAQGASDAAVSRELDVHPNTVNYHRRALGLPRRDNRGRRS